MLEQRNGTAGYRRSNIDSSFTNREIGNPPTRPTTQSKERGNKSYKDTTTVPNNKNTTRTNSHPTPYTKTVSGMCYRCRKPWHLSNACPECSRPVNWVEEEGKDPVTFEDEEEGDLYDRAEVAADKGEQVSCVVQRVMYSPRQDKPNQWNNIFCSCCTISRKACDLIVDSGSCENFMPEDLKCITHSQTVFQGSGTTSWSTTVIYLWPWHEVS